MSLTKSLSLGVSLVHQFRAVLVLNIQHSVYTTRETHPLQRFHWNHLVSGHRILHAVVGIDMETECPIGAYIISLHLIFYTSMQTQEMSVITVVVL